MHRLGAVAIATLVSLGSLAVALPALACGTGKVQFEDKFASADPSWNFAATDLDRTMGPDGLTYKWKPNTAFTTLNQSGFYDDYEVCAQVSMQFVPNANGYVGVAFWGTDNDNLYTFDVSPVYGTFTIYRGQHGKFLQPIKWTESAAIKKASGDVNDISIALKGNHAIVTINGTKVAEFNGQPPDGGSLPGIDLSTSKKDTDVTTLSIKDFQVRAVE